MALSRMEGHLAEQVSGAEKRSGVNWTAYCITGISASVWSSELPVSLSYDLYLYPGLHCPTPTYALYRSPLPPSQLPEWSRLSRLCMRCAQLNRRRTEMRTSLGTPRIN